MEYFIATVVMLDIFRITINMVDAIFGDFRDVEQKFEELEKGKTVGAQIIYILIYIVPLFTFWNVSTTIFYAKKVMEQFKNDNFKQD